MDTLNSRNGVVLISAIISVIMTALFFAVPTTATTTIAYLFTILAIVMYCVGSLYMLSNTKSYPWFAVFPITIWRYFLIQLALSLVFAIRDIFFIFSFPTILFFFLHIVLLGLFAIILIIFKDGKEIIQAKDAEIKEKVMTIRQMQFDVEQVKRRFPQYEKPLAQVIDALRYSDPMSDYAVFDFDIKIQDSIATMSLLKGNDIANIPNICETLLIQIADRNSFVKMRKY